MQVIEPFQSLEARFADMADPYVVGRRKNDPPYSGLVSAVFAFSGVMSSSHGQVVTCGPRTAHSHSASVGRRHARHFAWAVASSHCQSKQKSIHLHSWKVQLKKFC